MLYKIKVLLPKIGFHVIVVVSSGALSQKHRSHEKFNH